MNSLKHILPVLMALSACSHHGEPTVAPPPGTGVELIDMAGDWTIVDLQRLDSTLPLPTQSLVPLFPPANGEILQIAGGQLVDFEGQPLYFPTPETPVQQYLNVADGRVLLFRLVEHFKAPGCVSHTEIAAAFGSVAPGEMFGDVLVL